MNSTRIAQYFHTIRYLKFKQIFFQLYYICKYRQNVAANSLSRLCKRSEAIQPLGVHSWIASLRLQRRRIFFPLQTIEAFTPGLIGWKSPIVLPPSLSDSGEFAFQGEAGQIDEAGIWNDSQHSKLWLYNLHYFDELNRIDADSRCELLNRYILNWIENNPPYTGNGWEPYPLSLRLVNWVKWFSRHGADKQGLASLVIQADALTRKIEYHILGNHLFANGKALVFVGVYFSENQGVNWLKKGLQILDREIKEQFLTDGGHFELSPMYHATLLWDICDLVHLADQSNNRELLSRKASWHAVIARGLAWISSMVHPDGEIAFFNDAAFGIAPTLTNLFDYAQKLGLSLSHRQSLEVDLSKVDLLKDSGYCVVNLANNGKAILDVAKIGPDYQPGHAHADTLSFELSLYGTRFLVNSGTSQYGENLTRQFQRSTKAHNTVNIDNKNSSEMWAGFRVAKRAYPRDLSIHTHAQKVYVECAHDGFMRLPGRNLHRRAWIFSTNSMIIRDIITGRYSDAEARFYFHPDVRVIKKNDATVVCYMLNGQEILVSLEGAESVCVEPSNWYPYFGVSIKNTCLIATFKEQELETKITW